MAAGQRGNEKYNLGKPIENLTAYPLTRGASAMICLPTTRGTLGIVPPKTGVFIIGAVLMVGTWTLAMVSGVASMIGVARVSMNVEIIVTAIACLVWVSFVEVFSLKSMVPFWTAAWVVACVRGRLTPSATRHLLPRMISGLTVGLFALLNFCCQIVDFDGHSLQSFF